MDPFTINRIGQIQHQENIDWSARQKMQQQRRNRRKISLPNPIAFMRQQMIRHSFEDIEEQTTETYPKVTHSGAC